MTTTGDDDRMNDWVKEYPCAVTVCDRGGTILELNDRAAKAFADRGGRQLVGGSLFDCHPEPARTKLRELLEKGLTNVYTVEQGGIRKLVYQAPWRRDGEYCGLVELVLELPGTLPHFVRD